MKTLISSIFLILITLLSASPAGHAQDVSTVESSKEISIDADTVLYITSITELTPIPTATPTSTPKPVQNKIISRQIETKTPKTIQTPSSTPTPLKPINNCLKIDIPTIQAKIRAAFPEDPEAAVLIATWESRLDNCAISKIDRNGRRNFGLFQVNGVNCGTDEQCYSMLDVDKNIQKARQLYLNRKGSWSAWGVCYKLNPCR